MVKQWQELQDGTLNDGLLGNIDDGDFGKSDIFTKNKSSKSRFETSSTAWIMKDSWNNYWSQGWSQGNV